MIASTDPAWQQSKPIQVGFFIYTIFACMGKTSARKLKTVNGVDSSCANDLFQFALYVQLNDV